MDRPAGGGCRPVRVWVEERPGQTQGRHRRGHRPAAAARRGELRSAAEGSLTLRRGSIPLDKLDWPIATPPSGGLIQWSNRYLHLIPPEHRQRGPRVVVDRKPGGAGYTVAGTGNISQQPSIMHRCAGSSSPAINRMLYVSKQGSAARCPVRAGSPVTLGSSGTTSRSVTACWSAGCGRRSPRSRQTPSFQQRPLQSVRPGRGR